MWLQVNLVMAGVASLPDEQPVILSRIFPSKPTAGYSAMTDRRCIAAWPKRPGAQQPTRPPTTPETHPLAWGCLPLGPEGALLPLECH